MGFFSSFTGSAQRRDLRHAQKNADAALDSGYQQSQGYYDQAAGGISSYANAGQKASQFYDDIIGLNGGDARTAAQGTLTSDPLFQGQLAQNSNSVLRALNARGESGGGKAYLAGQRVLNDTYGSWLDRYAGRSQDGFQANSALAGIRTAQGDNAYGYGATKANMAMGAGNAMAQSRGIGVNNLMNAAGMAVKARARMP